eukprot:TRINITY_DN54993_c0_g1_i1.p1 TRINITY_DN54993_c0_g1~~TRINITY_DN54993_c0_g1_i1.p1  ORF type:complete len:671 (+),score=18.98 TRINITY_DN54993_c0_g1_i1:47-2059(+)
MMSFGQLLTSLIFGWIAVTFWVLQMGQFRESSRAERVQFSRAALVLLICALGTLVFWCRDEVWLRISNLLLARVDARNISILRVGVALLTYMLVFHWAAGLYGHEEREIFDCGTEFCFPSDAYTVPPTLASIYSALRIPQPTMEHYGYVRFAVRVSLLFLAIGFCSRTAAFTAAIGLTYILGLRVSWTFGRAAHEMVDNHILWVLLLCSAFPPLGEGWSVDALIRKHSGHSLQKSSTLCLHVVILCLLGINYLGSGLWKIGESGFDWILDSRILMSWISVNTACGALAEGPPPVGLHTFFSPHWVTVILAASTIALEVFFMIVILFSSSSRRRAIVYFCLFCFHAGIRLSMNIDFWSMQWLYLFLTEWIDDKDRCLADHAESRSLQDADKHDTVRTLCARSPVFFAVSFVTLASAAYKNYVGDNTRDFPVCGYPKFDVMWPPYGFVGRNFPCRYGDDFWNLVLTFEPPLGGHHQLSALTALVPHHQSYYMGYAVLLERVLLLGDKNESVTALRYLLEMLRYRLDPNWLGVSVSITAEARMFSRSKETLADVGEVQSVAVQNFSVHSDKRYSRSLFQHVAGTSARGAFAAWEPQSWSVVVCGDVLSNASFLQGALACDARCLNSGLHKVSDREASPRCFCRARAYRDGLHHRSVFEDVPSRGIDCVHHERT